MNQSISEQVKKAAFDYGKSLYNHAKDEDIKDSSQVEAFLAGASFRESLGKEGGRKQYQVLMSIPRIRGGDTQEWMLSDEKNYNEFTGEKRIVFVPPSKDSEVNRVKEIATRFAEWIDKNNYCIKSGGYWIVDSLNDLKTTEQLYQKFINELPNDLSILLIPSDTPLTT